ncbi:MAG TPA: UPF0149 family protein [Caldimonas sp.]|jgi:uncharacterized protein|nr:UPF0149 family protein [Caldimonas sp.]HEX2540668.1 UPF0149 family protein [Caldimonas sp.]
MSLPTSVPPSRPALAAAASDLSDAEFAELDELLAGIPEPLEPLDVVMLDGFLCGVIVQPRLIEADEWLPYVFDAGGHRWGEAEPSAERLRAESLVLRRKTALVRSIVEFGGFDPFILEPEPAGAVEGDGEGTAAEAGEATEATTDASEPAAPPHAAPDPATDTGTDAAAPAATASPDPLAEALLPWVAGFEQAVHLFPELAELRNPAVEATLARLFRFLPAEGDDELATLAVLARERPLPTLDAAIAEVVACVAELHDLTEPLRYKVDAVRREHPKVGRNEPCPCGSGRKFKQCHGARPA